MAEKEMGFIKLFRTMHKTWGWYTDIPVKVLFIHLLLTVNWETKSWKGAEIKPGQIFTSVDKLSVATGLTSKQIRLALSKLVSTGEISVTRANKGQLITVENWAFYQCEETEEGEQRAIKGQTKGNQRATTKELKELKELKEIYLLPGEEEKLRRYTGDVEGLLRAYKANGGQGGFYDILAFSARRNSQ